MDFYIPCKPDVLKDAVIRIILFAKENGIHDQEMIQNIKLATHEALVNAMLHGNKCKDGSLIGIKLSFSDDKLTISITDQGCGFDFISKINCDTEKFSDCGRGIFLIKHITDSFEFLDGGKTIVLSFNALQ